MADNEIDEEPVTDDGALAEDEPSNKADEEISQPKDGKRKNDYDEDDDEEEEGPKKRLKQKKKSTLVDAEAGEDEDADSDADKEAGGSSGKKRLLKRKIAEDDSSEEDENEEMTEEDRKFIADEEEDDAGEVRPMPKIDDDLSDDMDEIDEDDLDLLSENRRKFKKRLHKKSEALTALVESDGENQSGDEEEESEDDMIEETEEQRKEKMKSRISGKPRASQEQSDTLGVLQDIFGDDFSGLMADTQDEEDKPQPTLRDVVEPSILTERMRTLQDAEILAMDMPERLQPMFVVNGEAYKPSPEQLIQEAQWIIEQPPFDERKDKIDLEQSIHAVLKCLRQEFMEIPFIYHYRRDYFDTILSRDDLWHVFDLDTQWRNILSRRARILKQYNEIIENDISKTDHYLEEQLAAAATEDDSKDVQDYFKLHYAAPTQKRRGKFALYHAANNEDGLREFAKKMSLSAEKFGENLIHGYHRHEPEDPEVAPADLARDYVTAAFRDPQKVMFGARAILCAQFACDPMVRRGIRERYLQVASVSIRPTKKGKDEIDRFHHYADIKYISFQPIKQLEPGSFLRLVKAESEGYITVSLTSIGSNNTKFFNDLRQQLISDGTSDVANAWNNERTIALKDAIDLFLAPMLESALRARLEKQASEWVISRCQTVFESKLMVAPFGRAVKSEKPTKPQRRRRNDRKGSDSDSDGSSDYEAQEDNDGPSGVLAISWLRDDGTKAVQSSATMGALLTSDGEMKAFIRLEHMRQRLTRGAPLSQIEVKQRDLDALRDFVLERRPAAIVVGTNGVDARNLFEDVNAVVADIEKRTANVYRPAVFYVDDEVAVLYAKSERAKKEFHDYPQLLHYCISLGRRLLDPLAEFASLATRLSNELHFLKLHPLQQIVPRDLLLDALERSLVNAVAAAGVDLNKCLRFPHLSYVLPFVPGLGYRRAFELSERAQNKTSVRSRTQLVTELGMLNTVFINCSPFLCIKPSFIKSKSRRHEEDDTDALDQTRIHVESYTFARRMSADALEEEVPEEELERSSAIIQKLHETPDYQARLAGFNREQLLEYANKLKELGDWRRVHTLQTLQRELSEPFKETRKPYESPSGDQLFSLLTGETDETLYPGLMVHGVVTKVAIDTGLISIRLDSGLFASMRTRDLSDAHSVQIPSVNDPIVARVTKILKDRFLVELSSRESDMACTRRSMIQPLYSQNKFYDDDAEQRDIDDDNVSKIAKSKKHTPRTIAHESFRNFTYREAEESLAASELGNYVLRPSSKGQDFLAVTVKMGPELFLHIDIHSRDKAHPFDSIGRSLYIGQERFNDMDEVLARYVQPISSFMQDALQHRKFLARTQVDIEAKINRDKELNRNSIPYHICQVPDRPSRLMLMFKPGDHIKQEYIEVTPNGFQFRFEVNRKSFVNLEDLFDWFKKNVKNFTRMKTD